jgi:CBS domain-containing protein
MKSQAPARPSRPTKAAFGHRKLGLKIRDIMTREVVTVPATASVHQAATLMSTREVGLLPVCHGARVVGVLTDRDITVRAAASGRSLRTTQVREVMTPRVVYCYEDEDVKDAVDSMAEQQIRRVLVFNRQQRLTGVLSIGDLALDTGDTGLAGELLQCVSQPDPPPESPAVSSAKSKHAGRTKRGRARSRRIA